MSKLISNKTPAGRIFDVVPPRTNRHRARWEVGEPVYHRIWGVGTIRAVYVLEEDEKAYFLNPRTRALVHFPRFGDFERPITAFLPVLTLEGFIKHAKLNPEQEAKLRADPLMAPDVRPDPARGITEPYYLYGRLSYVEEQYWPQGSATRSSTLDEAVAASLQERIQRSGQIDRVIADEATVVTNVVFKLRHGQVVNRGSANLVDAALTRLEARAALPTRREPTGARGVRVVERERSRTSALGWNDLAMGKAIGISNSFIASMDELVEGPDRQMVNQVIRTLRKLRRETPAVGPFTADAAFAEQLLAGLDFVESAGQKRLLKAQVPAVRELVKATYEKVGSIALGRAAGRPRLTVTQVCRGATTPTLAVARDLVWGCLKVLREDATASPSPSPSDDVFEDPS